MDTVSYFSNNSKKPDIPGILGIALVNIWRELQILWEFKI